MPSRAAGSQQVSISAPVQSRSLGRRWSGSSPNFRRYICQIRSRSAGPGRSTKKIALSRPGPGELGRQLGDVVGREDEERIAGVVGQVRQQRPELAGGDPAVAGAALLDAGQALLDLVDERDMGPRRRQDPQRLPGPLLGLADERAHERADVEEERGPARLVAQRLGERRLARARRRPSRSTPRARPAGSRVRRAGGRTT